MMDLALLFSDGQLGHLSQGLIEDDWEIVRNLAAALFLLETPRSPEDAERAASVEEWASQPAQRELLRTFAEGLVQVLLSACRRDIEVSAVDLQAIKAELAARIEKWTLQEDLAVVRKFLEQRLTVRFDSVPEGVREQLEAINSMEALVKLLARISQISSLATLDSILHTNANSTN